MWSGIKPSLGTKIIVLLALVYLVIQPSFAQDARFGIRAGFYSGLDNPFIGTEYLVRIGKRTYINPNVEYVFVNHGTFMTFNVDAHYDLPTRSNVYVWTGGGLAFLYRNLEGRVDSRTDMGLNLLFGLGFGNAGSVVPYIQGKAILSDNSDFALAFGLRF